MAFDAKAYQREYYKKYHTPARKERQKELTLEYRRQHVARVFLQKKRNLCKQQGVEFKVSEEDILPLPTECPVLGIPLNYLGGKMSDATATLDRIEPEGGYVRGNVRIISMLANRIKSDANAWQLSRILAYVRGEI